MYQSNDLDVWNLTSDVKTITDAQRILNIVGCLKSPDKISRFTYSLNNGAEKPIFFNSTENRLGRLQNHGDFNIDTIKVSDLKVQNRLTFKIFGHTAKASEHHINFPNNSNANASPNFNLDLDGFSHPQEVGQVVDGKWQISCDEAGEPCLEIKNEDAGYDRIIVFGHHDWTSAYEINARLCVTAWTHYDNHNVGLVFKWNPHLQGDGTHLPTQWSTGLGYYNSHSPGLRIRFGVNVHLDAQGEKIGNYILGEAPFSLLRQWIGKMRKYVLPRKRIYSQIVPGEHYRFRMLVHPEKYTLTVWKQGKKEPYPQIMVPKPVERLPIGATGIIAHHCTVRVFEFNVSQVDQVRTL